MKNSRFSYVFTQGFLALCSWGMLSLIGKKLGAESLGEYSFALSVISPLILFAGFQMRQSYLTNDNFTYESYLGTRSILLLSLIVIFLLTGQVVNIDLILSLLILKSSDSIWEIVYSRFQKEKKLTLGSVISIVRYSFMIITLYYSLNILTTDLSNSLLYSAAVGFFFTAPMFFNSKITVNLKIPKDLWRLGGAAVVTAVLFNLPRYSIKYHYGNYELGIFTAIISFYGLWQVFFNSYFNSILDRLSTQSSWSTIKLPLFVFVICGTVFLFKDEMIYQLMFGDKLMIASKYSNSLLLLIISSLYLSFENYRLIASGNYKSQLNVTLQAFVLGVPSVFIMTALYGLRGSLLTYACLLICQASRLRHIYGK